MMSSSEFSRNQARYLWLVVLCLTLGHFSWADDRAKAIGQYVHNSWSTDNGLPQNSVQNLLQTRDGYLWMGTEEGLVRFNGAQFMVFNKDNTEVMKHNDIRALFEERAGNLWVGTFSGGALRYRNGEFRSYTVRDGLSNNFVNCILQAQRGRLWFGTNGGLNELKAGKFIHYGKSDGLSDANINALAETPDGDLWIGTNGGLYRIHRGVLGGLSPEKLLTRIVVT